MLFPSFLSSIFVVLFSFLLSSPYLVEAQQNAKEEAICSRFLTSPQSSPILENLQRDLKYDEDAEFSCELVLQDRFLPAQIRLTIHEGLYYLQQRHLALGQSKEIEAARHSTVLAEILPNSYKFRYFAGLWQLSPKINKPEVAFTHLHHCLYGKAAKDDDESITENLRYQTKLLYIQALGQLGRMDEVKAELMELLQSYPLDFRSQFLLEEMVSSNTTTTNSIAVDGEHGDEHSSTHLYTKMLERLIGEVTEEQPVVFQQYHGVLDKDSAEHWDIPVLTQLPTAEEFDGYIHRREPFIVSFGSVQALDEALSWKVSKWVDNVEYWKLKVDDEETLQVEGMPKSLLEGCILPSSSSSSSSGEGNDAACGQFGLHLQRRSQSANVHEIFSNQFQDQNYSYYLNIQPGYSGRGLYRSPLHFVTGDIPVKKQPFFSEIMKNMTTIQLWTGRTTKEHQATMSRLHRDATDNLYFLLQGKKQFTLWSPRDSLKLRTIGPTFGVNPDGLSYQFDVNAFRKYMLYRLHNENKTLEQIFSQAHTNSEYYHLLDSVRSKVVTYSSDEHHFSKLTTHKSQAAVQAAGQCSAEDSCPATSEQEDNNVLPPPAAVVEMKPGDLIFLPTGWFHQVKSYGGAHMAINYWWKPLNWAQAKDMENEVAQKLFDALWDKLTGPSPVETEA